MASHSLSPDTCTSSPAADATFSTNELFEQILLRLDTKTLLLSQRVASFWCIVIGKSKLLQKKLFLLPATKEDLAKINIIEAGSGRGLNVNAVKVFKECNKVSESEILVLNPLLLAQTAVRYPLKDGPTRRAVNREPVCLFRNADSIYQPSWEKMLLLQPSPVIARGCLNATIPGTYKQLEMSAMRDNLGNLALHVINAAGRLDMTRRGESVALNLWFLGHPVDEEDLDEMGIAIPQK